MAHKIIKYIPPLLLFVGLQGCYYDKAAILKTGIPCDTIDVSFAADINPMITENCVSCHGNTSPSAGISLVGYSNIQAVAGNGKLLGSLRHETGYSAMPKNAPKFDDCKINLITRWINTGKPNN